MKAINYVAWILLIVGGLNWLLVGLAGVDAVASIFGSAPILERTIYVLVGISALYLLFLTPRVSRSFGPPVAGLDHARSVNPADRSHPA